MLKGTFTLLGHCSVAFMWVWRQTTAISLEGKTGMKWPLKTLNMICSVQKLVDLVFKEEHLPF